MPCILAVLAVSLCAPGRAEPVVFDNVPEVYSLAEDGTVTASDGGESTGDHYLLSAASYRDFVLSFSMTDLPAGGDRRRAILVWAIDPADPANRNSIFLDQAQPGQERRIRLVVLAGRVQLFVDGQLTRTSATPYGEPPTRGRVGFLHYYNYHYRYRDIDIAPLDPERLPAPRGLDGEVLPSGAIRLSWRVPVGYEGLLGYRVYAARHRRPRIARSDLIGSSDSGEFLYRDVRSETTYNFVVAAGVGDASGGASEPLSLVTDDLPAPAPPVAAEARLRIDGSARVSWRLAPDARAGTVDLLRGPREPDKVEPGAAEAALTGLSAERGSAVLPPAAARHCAIRINDPDRRRPALLAVRAEASVPTTGDGPAVPHCHPYLLYSAEQIARARRRAAEDPAAAGALETLRQQAEASIKTPLPIPQEASDEHSRHVPALQRVALAYALTGEPRFAAWVRDAIVRYADLYPTLPIAGNGRTRIVGTASGLYEAVWYQPVLLAYDLTAAAEVYSEADHRHVREDLLRLAAQRFWVQDYNDPSDGRPGDLHYKCYNFQAWFISCVGMTGLVLQDPDMVEYAIDGPYGLKHLLGHDVRDDGLFWERSLGYHGFVLSALHPFLEAASHCNLDLYALRVADGNDEDLEPSLNYAVGDGDNGPRSIRTMLDAPFYAIYGDMTYANVGDSNAGPLRSAAYHRAGWERYRDPKYAWLLLGGREPERESPAALWAGEGDASASVFAGYDGEYLYLAADIRDNVVRNSHPEPEQVWAGDLLWVGLNWQAEGSAYDVIYGLSPGDGADVPPAAVCFNRFGAIAHSPCGGPYRVLRVDGGYRLELALPLSELRPTAQEQGEGLKPAAGTGITADFVLYDSDSRTGATGKDKMLAWASTSDRYDTGQGGRLVFDGPATGGERELIAPRVEGWRVDADIDKWHALGVRPARIGAGSAVTTDAAAGPGIEALMYSAPTPGEAAFTLRGTGFAQSGVLHEGSSLYPGSGFIVLRDRLAQDGLPPREATCLTMTYGPYGGGHGHPDKLSIVLYAEGKQWVPDFGSCAYESSEKAQWTSHTISHNTVVIDGVSQYPAGGSDFGWPADSFTRRAVGRLNWFHADSLVKAGQAECDGVYSGVLLRRLSAVVADAAVDFFSVDSDAEHQYDYPLHVAGELAASDLELRAVEGALGDRCGYQHIGNVRAGRAEGPVGTSWVDDSGRRLWLGLKAGPGDELLVGDGYTNSPQRLMPTVILRRRASSTVFASCLVPGEGRTEATWLDAGGAMTALRLHTPGGPRLVLFSQSGTGGRCEGLSFRGALAVADEVAGVVSVVGGEQVQFGAVRVRAQRPCSLQAAPLERGIQVQVGLEDPGRLRIGGRWNVERRNAQGDWEAVQSRALRADTAFAAEPRGLYRLRRP